MLEIHSDGSQWLVDGKGRRPYRWYHASLDWCRCYWYGRDFRKKQQAFRRSGTRYYGDGGTIHSCTAVDVEVYNGRVVSVWFRCQPLPFRQADVSADRAVDMERMYSQFSSKLHGVEIKDKATD